MKTKTLTLGAIALVLLAGCTMAPKYEQPSLPVETAYAGATDEPAAVKDIAWQDFFGDPRLQSIIKLTLENNRDLRVAALRVEQAAAQYRIERAALLPTVAGSGGYTRSRTPAEFSMSRQPSTGNQFTVGVGIASYELDFFGRVRSLKDAALETYLATEEARRSSEITLIAGVASQYLAERALDEQLVIAEDTLKTVEDSYDLIKKMYDGEVVSELDLKTAETQVHSTRASVADIKRQLAQARNALVLLVGAPLPADLPAPLPLGRQGIIAELPAGVPSDLLTRRPDILQAEHTLRSANASIGAARAAFFPSISLTGNGGFGSVELDNLFKSDSFMWSFAPSINVPIFTGGRLKANLAVTEANQKIMLAQYEKTIQTAFKEVSDALVARTTYVDQIKAQELRVASEQRRYDLSDTRYKQGVDSYLTVLTAQQGLFSAQQGLVQARLAQLANYVTLYKSLGGGWVQQQQQ
ncbi:efflux transporter outer membrane subunit [Ereboglobus luteus]|uniref:Multidrug transporter n=1 Tax=Ereboglobus luteus TaxID=1796921 RepID=A0A2U8E563_9BACT|nr:efflux transporter outer membrane subunit [Ereboglobus luteus]AWI09997.1 multidrug transporter [Ereboglobus luteus]